MSRKFMENLDQEGGDVVPAGDYTATVVDSRALDDKAFIWMDLKIQGGPDDGRIVSVGLNIPDDSASRGAIFHFKNKIKGFLPAIMPLKIFDLPDEDQPGAIADAILGATIDVKLEVEQSGMYAGRQQLGATSPVATQELPDAPVAAAPAAPAAAPAAAAPTPSAQQAAQDLVAAAATAPTDEVPF